VAGLISNRIKQVKYRKHGLYGYFYIRVQEGARMYKSYEDCVNEENPITNQQDISSLLLKFKDYMEAYIVDNKMVVEEEKKIALIELSIIFENIFKTNNL
jgi:hypothetical protein